MKNPFVFASVCPACGQERMQHAHTRRALVRSIEANQVIDAYCLECDLVWPIGTQERALIACTIMVERKERIVAGGSHAPAHMGCLTERITRFDTTIAATSGGPIRSITWPLLNGDR